MRKRKICRKTEPVCNAKGQRQTFHITKYIWNMKYSESDQKKVRVCMCQSVSTAVSTGKCLISHLSHWACPSNLFLSLCVCVRTSETHQTRMFPASRIGNAILPQPGDRPEQHSTHTLRHTHMHARTHARTHAHTHLTHIRAHHPIWFL